MNTTLLTAGVACVVAGIVGGGLKAWGIEIPSLQSVKRQSALVLLGIGLLVSSGAFSVIPNDLTISKKSPEPEIPQTTNTIVPIESRSAPPNKSVKSPVSVIRSSIGIEQFSIDDYIQKNADFPNSFIEIAVPDADFNYYANMTDSFPVKPLNLVPGVHNFYFHSHLRYRNEHKNVVSDCTVTVAVTSARLYRWTLQMEGDKGLTSCQI